LSEIAKFSEDYFIKNRIIDFIESIAGTTLSKKAAPERAACFICHLSLLLNCHHDVSVQLAKCAALPAIRFRKSKNSPLLQFQQYFLLNKCEIIWLHHQKVLSLHRNQ